MAASLEIHLEDSYHAVEPPIQWPMYITPPCALAVRELLKRLQTANVHATWYIVGDFAKKAPALIEQIVAAGHQLGSHGYWHRRGEHIGDQGDIQTRELLPTCRGYRSPFWSTTPRPGMAGGVFFRTLPYALLKREIQRHQLLYLHPHDFFPSEKPWRRRVFLCNPWKRLQRLLTELDWHDPR